jgi:hypothetical protein
MVGLEQDSDNAVWDEAVQLIKSDALRCFNIDIETDSTIAPDVEAEKEAMSDALEAIGAYGSTIFPLVQAGALPMPAAVEMLRKALRIYRFGRDLDEVLDEAAKQQPPNPEQQKADAEAQAAQKQQEAEMQAEQQRLQMEMKVEEQKAQMEQQKAQAKLQQDAAKAAQDLRQDQEQHEQEMQQMREKGAIELQIAKELGEAKKSAIQAGAGSQTLSNR